jgi:hypothetical protein
MFERRYLSSQYRYIHETLPLDGLLSIILPIKMELEARDYWKSALYLWIMK